MKKAMPRLLVCFLCAAAAFYGAAEAAELRLKSGRAVNGEVKYVTRHTIVFQTNSQVLFLPAALVDMSAEEWLQKARESFENKELENAEGLCRQSLALSSESAKALVLLKEIGDARFDRRMKMAAEVSPASQNAEIVAPFLSTTDAALPEGALTSSSLPLEAGMAERSLEAGSENLTAERVPEAFPSGTAEATTITAGATPPTISPVAVGMPLSSSSGAQPGKGSQPPAILMPGPFGVLANVAYGLATSAPKKGSGSRPSPTTMPIPVSAGQANFNEAEARARVSRARTDMRSLATAIEAYNVKTKTYPPALQPYLVSPVAFITSIPADPFSPGGDPYHYWLDPATGRWIVWSVGPDQTDNRTAVVYDPSNGTVSAGDIPRYTQQKPTPPPSL